jgi:acyl transferase domain-containing protein
MAAFNMSSEQLAPHLTRWPDVGVSVVNSPDSCVVSGPSGQLADAVAELRSAARARMLPVDYASHSPQVERLRDELRAALGEITPRAARIPFYSSVTGTPTDGTELDAEYWYTNLREPVRFDRSLTALIADGHRRFIEVGPHPLLLGPIEETAAAIDVPDVVTLGSLRRDDGDADRFLRSLAQAHAAGVDFDADAVFGRYAPHAVDLPTYPFQNRRYWLTEGGMVNSAKAGFTATSHAILGAAVDLPATGGRLLTGSVSVAGQPWLADHTVDGTVVVPGAALVEMVIRAADETGGGEIAELTLRHPMTLPDGRTLPLQMAVGAPDSTGRRTVSLYSHGNAERSWLLHADGVLAGPSADDAEPAVDLSVWPPAGARRVAALPDGVAAGWTRGDELFSEVALPAALLDERSRYGLHPVLLDGVLSTIGLSTTDSLAPTGSWTGVRLHAADARVLRVRVTPQDGGVALDVADATGRAVLTVRSVRPAAATPDVVPAIGRSAVVAMPARRSAADTTDERGDARLLVADLAAMRDIDRDRTLTNLVRDHLAAVLRRDDPAALSPSRTFKELGMESVSAVDLRNRLSAVTGKRLAATVVFDHATPARLAAHLRDVLLPDPAAATVEPPAPRVETVVSPDIDGIDSIDEMDIDALIALATGGAVETESERAVA